MSSVPVLLRFGIEESPIQRDHEREKRYTPEQLQKTSLNVTRVTADRLAQLAVQLENQIQEHRGPYYSAVTVKELLEALADGQLQLTTAAEQHATALEHATAVAIAKHAKKRRPKVTPKQTRRARDRQLQQRLKRTAAGRKRLAARAKKGGRK